MKRKKAGLMDLVNVGVEYHAFQRVKSQMHGYGWRYILSKPLTEEQKKTFEVFKNVSMSTCQYKCAPELKYNTITLFDKCKKEA